MCSHKSILRANLIHGISWNGIGTQTATSFVKDQLFREALTLSAHFVARITMFISQQNRFSTHYCYFSPNNYEDISSLYKKLSLNMVYEKILKELILIYTN